MGLLFTILIIAAVLGLIFITVMSFSEWNYYYVVKPSKEGGENKDGNNNEEEKKEK